MTRFLRIAPMVSGSSATSAKLSLRVKRVTLGVRIAQWQHSRALIPWSVV